MYQHILVPTDGSKLSANAVAEGIKLAGALGSKLTFLSVNPSFASLGELDHAFSGMPDSFRREALAFLEGEARDALAKALSSAKSAGVAADTVFVESGHPDEAIIAAAGSKGVDLILMASHGRSGVKAVLLGSTTQKVLAHTKLPVLVCR